MRQKHLASTTWSEPRTFPGSPHRSGSLAEAGGGQVLLAQRGEVDVEFRVVRLGLDAEFVGAALAEPVDVFGQVRRDVRQVWSISQPSSSSCRTISAMSRALWKITAL